MTGHTAGRSEPSAPSRGSALGLPQDPGLSLFIISLVCYLAIASAVAAVLWVRLWAADDYIRLLQANRRTSVSNDDGVTEFVFVGGPRDGQSVRSSVLLKSMDVSDEQSGKTCRYVAKTYGRITHDGQREYRYQLEFQGFVE